MASLLDLYRSVFGGEADQGAPMAVQNRQGGFDPYTPAKPPDALELLYEMSGGKDLSEAYGAAQRGEYLPALGQGAWGAAQAATMAYPALKAGGAALRAGAPLAREAAAAMPGLLADETGAIRAWHASPYDFNKFDSSKIGTGQGAQSYGHGIYAAESPAVSGKGGQYDLEFTAKNLGKYDLNPGELQIHRMLRTDRSDMDILGELARGGDYTFDEALAALERVKGAKAKIYEVDIHADPKAFLDWDRSLAGQSPEVLTALQQKLGQPTGLPPGYRLRQTSSGDYMVADDLGMGVTGKGGVVARGRTPEEALRLYLPTGDEVYNRLAGRALAEAPGATKGYMPPPGFNAQAEASELLKEAGIPGIRYLDQGSRGAGDPVKLQQQIDFARRFADDTDLLPRDRVGWQQRVAELEADLAHAKANPPTSNYAIFDPSIIEILRKYGILPPVAGAAGAGLLGGGEESY